MLNWLSRRSDLNRTAGDIYGSIVASARQETFYAVWGVPDSREGRFEMLALHVALVMIRLARAGSDGSDLSRRLAETFMTDMDDNMREIGIGDLAVPKKIKRAAAALFDRHRDYGAALRQDPADAALGPIVTAAFTGDNRAELQHQLDTVALVHYIERLSGGLDVTSDVDCLAGRLPLPWPPR